jgi:hypothetical protein
MMRQVKHLLTYLFLGLMSVLMSTVSAQEVAEKERLLKAVFIYNFAKFTRWPESVWGGEPGALTLCTAGKDQLAAEVERLSGRVIKGHPLSVQSWQGVEQAEDCQVLYIARSEQPHYRTLIDAVQGKPILTVSEIEGFARSGGAIELYHEKDKIRFLINIAVAREAGLVISSRLLSLAEVIGMEEMP